MDRNHFQNEINRLSDTFGTQCYKAERVRVLWRELEPFSNTWMSRVVDMFIGNCRQAPLVPEFREEASKERERLRELEKKDFANDAKEFTSTYSGEDLKTICQQIVQRVEGRLDDNQFRCFKQIITPPKFDVIQCSRCQDTKLYRDDRGAMTFCNHTK